MCAGREREREREKDQERDQERSRERSRERDGERDQERDQERGREKGDRERKEIEREREISLLGMIYLLMVYEGQDILMFSSDRIFWKNLCIWYFFYVVLLR